MVSYFLKNISKTSLGNINEDVNFEYGEGSTAYYGCGVVFKGEYLYFGGEGPANNRQVSKYKLYSIVYAKHPYRYNPFTLLGRH